MKQLSGLDSSFLYFDQKNAPMHIGSVAIYDPATAPGGFVRFKDILGFIEGRLHLAKTFRQKLVHVPFSLDYPYWVEDPGFDLEFHVRHIALPKPGDWRQLCIQAARLHARPLDMGKPLWEFTIIEGLDNVAGIPKGAFAIVSKVHHAAIDGVSGVDIMNAIHSVEPDVSAPVNNKPWKPQRVPGAAEMLARGYIGNLKKPFRVLQVAGRTVPGMVRTAKGLVRGELNTGAALTVPRTRFNRTISPHRVFDAQSFDIETIKRLKDAFEGVKLNDVMLAIVGGALRRYLQARDELPEVPLVAMAPVSVRAENEKGTLGNRVSAMLVHMGTHIEEPRERVLSVFQSTQDSKALTHALGARQLADLSKLLPAMFSGAAARLYTQLGIANRMRPIFNTVVTNVPGPPIPIYSSGAQLVQNFSLMPVFDGGGLSHAVMSYDRNIAVSFTACRETMPDPDFYAQCLRDSFDELVDVLPEKPKTSDAPVVQKTGKPSGRKKKTQGRSSTKRKNTGAKKTGTNKAAQKKRPGPADRPGPAEHLDPGT